MDEDLSINPADLARLSPADQQELQQFLQNEGQKSQVQQTIHDLTKTCFRKCVSGNITSGKLAGKEEGCMANCVDRFLDSNLTVLKHLEMMRAQQ